jgi:nitrogen regulatory protein P-II 2
MTPSTMKLVTIIAEHVLRDAIAADLKRLGARGYSAGEVEGEGTRGIHAQDWQGKNVRLETIVTAAVADRIMSHLAATYFADYSVVAWTTNVEVWRSGKFS